MKNELNLFKLMALFGVSSVNPIDLTVKKNSVTAERMGTSATFESLGADIKLSPGKYKATIATDKPEDVTFVLQASTPEKVTPATKVVKPVTTGATFKHF